jgi:transcriptional regulator with XRE-family HTH domain
MKPSLKEFKKKAVQNPEVKKEYDLISTAYGLKKQLIRIRKEAGLTQEEIADRLNTKKSNISRLENVNSKSSPKISTIEEYAKVAGFKIEINFKPLDSKGKSQQP